MGDNTNCLLSVLFNKIENKMYIKMYITMSFYSENSLLLLYVTRIRVTQSNMEVEYNFFVNKTLVLLSSVNLTVRFLHSILAVKQRFISWFSAVS